MLHIFHLRILFAHEKILRFRLLMLGEIKSCARAKKELCGWDFFVIIKNISNGYISCGTDCHRGDFVYYAGGFGIC